MDREEMRELIRETVKETLLSLGIEANDPMDTQRDFIFLREMRMTAEKVKSRGIFVLVGIILTALVSLLWLGLKGVLG